MQPFKWTCPYCNHDTTITEQNIRRDFVGLDINSKYGQMRAKTEFIVCPNSECNEVSFGVDLYKSDSSFTVNGIKWNDKDIFKSWALMPNSKAKVFPDYVPKSIVDDYAEACLICNLSPKASATLSRRCLQGIIRDFWKISKARLVDEIDGIKGKIDPLTWEAIDAVRKIGNIGAHMEKDINVVIDVDPNEATLLIELIEILIKEWYINRHERELRLMKIIEVKDKKETEKKK